MRAAQIPRPEPAGLLAEIDEDRARLEHADGFAVGSVRVHDRRGLAVPTYLQELRRGWSPLRMSTILTVYGSAIPPGRR